jgi:UMF1 family MFS transporter
MLYPNVNQHQENDVASIAQTNTLPSTNDKREINGWAMYDWANSAFSTTVGAVFLGPYLASLVENAAKASPDGQARFFGLPVAPDSFLPYCIAFSVVFQAGLLPILGAIADYSNRRKQMMRLFATLGATATLAMFFVQGNLWWLGGVLFIIANLAFGAAIVFYNAYLPDIASEDQRDRVSSFGWAMGYLGGGLLLILNLVIFLARDAIGVDGGLAVRINLASAGVWWLLWSLLTWQRLRSRGSTRELPPGENILSIAFKQLSATMEAPARTIATLLLSPLLVLILLPIVALFGLPSEVVFIAMLGPIILLGIFLYRKYRSVPETVKYLLSYLIYNDGIQTVIGTAAVFAAAPIARGGIGMPTVRLTLLVLMIQFMAFFGALLFGRLAKWLGTKRAIMLSLLIWSGAVIYAFLGLRNTNVAFDLPNAIGGPMLQQEVEYWVLGACIAVVLGGSQALSRSLFAQMIPKDREAEFFSIYEISERGTSWMGPFLFGFVNQTLGNLRPAILSVVIFFVVGLIVLTRANVKQAVLEAGKHG